MYVGTFSRRLRRLLVIRSSRPLLLHSLAPDSFTSQLLDFPQSVLLRVPLRRGGLHSINAVLLVRLGAIVPRRGHLIRAGEVGATRYQPLYGLSNILDSS